LPRQTPDRIFEPFTGCLRSRALNSSSHLDAQGASRSGQGVDVDARLSMRSCERLATVETATG
jgi:hypothetical protein